MDTTPQLQPHRLKSTKGKKGKGGGGGGAKRASIINTLCDDASVVVTAATTGKTKDWVSVCLSVWRMGMEKENGGRSEEEDEDLRNLWMWWWHSGWDARVS